MALNTDYIDLLLLHRPDPLLDADEVAEVLQQLVQAGKIRAVGVSNYVPAQFSLLQSRLSIPLVTNQIQLSLAHTEPLTNGTLDDTQERRISPMIWSPLGGGKMFDPQSQLAILLSKLGLKYGVSDSAMAIAWLLRLPSRPVPILGTMNIDRLHALAQADTVSLELQDWYKLLEVATGQPVT